MQLGLQHPSWKLVEDAEREIYQEHSIQQCAYVTADMTQR